MRIAMMGAGGIGGYVGARLAEAGEDVAFVARGAHLEAMRKDGLQVKSPFGDVHLTGVTATDDPAEIGPVDIVIFAVKLYDSDEAARAMLPLVGPDTRIVTLQNGIDSVATLSRFMPRAQIVGGATYLSGYVERPGLIVHAGSYQVYVGGTGDTALEAMCASCRRVSGIDARTVSDIDPVLWEKFVTLSAFSGGTSLMRAAIGSIYSDPEARTLIEQLLDEGMTVAAAAGHPMDDDFRRRAAERWTKLIPPDTRSSMANDLARGKPLELAWLSGRMHTLGQELGVPTPGHSAAYRALHMYAGGSKPKPS